ncbi:MAG: hypothetical protein WCW53_03760 [Syntrophales bacterium]
MSAAQPRNVAIGGSPNGGVGGIKSGTQGASVRWLARPLAYHFGGGGRGMWWNERAARRNARAVPVHGAAELDGGALA